MTKGLAGGGSSSRPSRKVLLSNVSLANGGLERQLLLLAQNLPADWEVRLWTLDGGPFQERVRQARIPWRCRPRRGRFDITPALDLWQAVGSWRPDVVHAWHWMPAAAAVPACRVLGIPLVDGSIRMGSVPRSLGRPRRSIMRWATIVVANSQAGLDAWRVGPEKGRVVYNAFDDRRLLGASGRPEPPAGTSGPFTVVMAARMDDQKDYASVIAAARRLDGEQPGGWRFLLVGDGADREGLVASARDLSARGTVEFRAPGLEAIDSIVEADAGVLMTDPSVRAEGTSNAVLEYMAAGLPVVCADTGGCREVVREGREGYLVAPFDVAALVDRLTYLKAHRDESRALGESGRARVQQEFTVARMVRDYVRIYEEAIAGAPGSVG